jgi:hypothetical protein
MRGARALKHATFFSDDKIGSHLQNIVHLILISSKVRIHRRKKVNFIFVDWKATQWLKYIFLMEASHI